MGLTLRGGREVTVDGEGGEKRADRLQDGVEEQQDQGGGDGQFVRPDVGEQAPHETPVVGFA